MRSGASKPSLTTHLPSCHLRACLRLVAVLIASTQILLFLCLPVRAEIPLPTPMDHYAKFKPGLSGLALASTIFPQLDAGTQQMLSQIMVLAEGAGVPR